MSDNLNERPILLALHEMDFQIIEGMGLPVVLLDGNDAWEEACQGQTVILLPVDSIMEDGARLRIVQHALLRGIFADAYRIPFFKGIDGNHMRFETFYIEDQESAEVILRTVCVDPVAGGCLRVEIPPELSLPPAPKLVVIGAREFIGLDFPIRSNILSPWLPSQGLVLIHSPRGVGKTYFSMLVAYVVSCGGKVFEYWHAPSPKGVLFIDGEMPGCVLQERLTGLISGMRIEPHAPLNILTPDLQPLGMPDLGTKQGQDLLEPHIENIDLIIVDNISTLIRSGKENEAEGWLPVQEWALRLRARGKSILFIHHSGKGGLQRGTSKREDVLDTVLMLKRPSDYVPEQGCRFEIHFEKARGLAGNDVKPIELLMIKDNTGIITWTSRTIDDSLHERIIEMQDLGLKQAEIAKELGVNRSTVCRHQKVAKAEGRYA